VNIPADLKYTKEHEWARLDGDVVTIGITDFAQGELGDIVFVDLPRNGSKVVKDQTFGTIEAVKAVSDLYSPITGEIVEVNDLSADPSVVNSDPYNKGWMVKVKMSNVAEFSGLMTDQAYAGIIK
jgi:glycine cleavage system H protein